MSDEVFIFPCRVQTSLTDIEWCDFVHFTIASNQNRDGRLRGAVPPPPWEARRLHQKVSAFGPPVRT